MAGRVRRGQRLAALAAGFVLAAVPVEAGATKAAPPVGGSEDCGWRVTRDYGPDSLTYHLHLELRGCGWWDGSARSPAVVVRRGAGHDMTKAQSPPEPCTSSTSQGVAGAGCDASVTLDHPEGETAHYAGAATWKWNDGQRRVAFDTTCTTTSETVSCADEDAGPEARKPSPTKQ